MNDKDFIYKPIEISLPILYTKSTSDEHGEFHILTTSPETVKMLGHSVVVQGKTFEEAESAFWVSVRVTHEFNKKGWWESMRWKPIRIGNWKRMGGRWLTIFGINFSFRWGRQNKHGWFIPFTPLNIAVSNYWKLPKKEAKNISVG